MGNLSVDYDGASSNVITPIQSEIEKMEDAAATITKLMGDLASYWSGTAFDKAVQTYQDDYKGAQPEIIYTKTRSRKKGNDNAEHYPPCRGFITYMGI